MNLKISSKYKGIKILSGSNLNTKIDIEANAASKKALDLFKKAGGKIDILDKKISQHCLKRTQKIKQKLQKNLQKKVARLNLKKKAKN